MRAKKIHFTLFALALVLLPPWFLIFTEDGARISDNALLWLWGEEGLELNIQKLTAQFSSEEIRQVYPDLDWQCRDQVTAFGNQLCAATIASINGYPARYISFFFQHDRLRAMKLVYRGPYHEQVLGHLLQQLGQPAKVDAAVQDGPDADTILTWDTGKGQVILKKIIADQDEPALMWIASASP